MEGSSLECSNLAKQFFDVNTAIIVTRMMVQNSQQPALKSETWTFIKPFDDFMGSLCYLGR